MEKIYDIAVIGSGPAGLTAAVYGRRAGKSVVLFEKETFGGQMNLTGEIQNYPGIRSVSGAELSSFMTDQAMDLGADAEFGEVVSVEKNGGIFTIKTDGEDFFSRTVIAAAGVVPRRLGLEGEEKLIGAGISFCAMCDGAFYAGKDVAVIGGGNTAVEDAVFLSDICRKVYLIHRRPSFRAEKLLVEKTEKKPNIEFVLDSVVKTLVTGADGKLTAAKVEKTSGDGQKSDLLIQVSGIFEAVGRIPSNGIFRSLAECDGEGYIVAGENCVTSCEGFFAAGDCRTKDVRQIATAVSDGACAATAACRYLS